VKDLSSKEVKGKVLLDSDVFIYYISGGILAEKSQKVIDNILKDQLEAYVSSMLYDDITSGLRAKGMAIDEVINFIIAVASIPHISLPVTSPIAISALTLYKQHGGPRKLHYFDVYHVATAAYYKLPIITSDKYIINKQKELGIKAINLKTI